MVGTITFLLDLPWSHLKLFWKSTFTVLLLGVVAFATLASPVAPAKPDITDKIIGLWEQYDDDTHLLTSIVRIVRKSDGGKAGDMYEGYVEKVIPGPGEEANPRCGKCKDGRKDQAVVGMQIISNLRHTNGDYYEQGEILDPDTGDIYRLRISVIESGVKLDVRGYIGISLFGRSQIWRRVAPITIQLPNLVKP